MRLHSFLLLTQALLLLRPVTSFTVIKTKTPLLNFKLQWQPHKNPSTCTTLTPLLQSNPNDDQEPDKVQMELDQMMRQQDPKGLQPTFLGKGGDSDDADGGSELGYNAVPLFTGGIVLLVSLFFTFYGFYVFFADYDPIFGNIRPTEPPPDSWYPGP